MDANQKPNDGYLSVTKVQLFNLFAAGWCGAIFCASMENGKTYGALAMALLFALNTYWFFLGFQWTKEDQKLADIKSGK